MKFIGIIPARYASTRFPGKPLARIGGMTMIERVCRQASKALDRVVVATDDSRILEAVKAAGFEAVMTSERHRSGTDRCYEAYKICGSDADVVINIQGDEPFIDPTQIDALKRCFDRPGTKIATLVRRFDSAAGYDALANPNTPKVVLDDFGRALYFSRSVIPYVRGAEKAEWPVKTQYYTHVGIYAFRADTLAELVNLPQSSLEKAESLEQLRWLQAGYPIQTAVTDSATIGIDTPDDLERAEKYLAAQTVPVDRSTPPPVVEFSDINIVPISSETLDNGVAFNVLNTGEQDICRVEFYVTGGLLDSADQAAMSVMAECMREQTLDYAPGRIADIVDFNGARLASRVADHYTALSVLVLDQNLPSIVPVLKSILTRATFTENTVVTAARRLGAAAATRLAQVMHVASNRAREAVTGAGHPSACVLRPEDFAAVTLDRVLACYDEFRQGAVHVYLGGRFSDSSLHAVRDIAASLTSAVRTGLTVIPNAPEGAGRCDIEVPDAVQAAVSMTLPTIGRDNSDYIPLRLTVMALGGYFGSRLMTNIREEKGLTYGISAALLGSREGAYVKIDAQCDANFVEQVIAETQAEITALVDNPPQGDELRRLRMYAWSVLAANTDSPLGLLDYYTTRLLVGTPADYFERQLHTIATLTPAIIAEMARKYLSAPMFVAVAR
ncbi:MAG: 3-deoxy-manno-octulosonate cytidylyltransferase [Muribaculaceae bacterium]|nr:3-deoxy-manno-octulosonate cytidylyltransferase [Muribaculaceae bacterium]